MVPSIDAEAFNIVEQVGAIHNNRNFSWYIHDLHKLRNTLDNNIL